MRLVCQRAQLPLRNASVLSGNLAGPVRRAGHRCLHDSTPSNPNAEKPTKQIIFSGIQPTGVPHLGNYLGALRQWVDLQHTSHKDVKLFYSVVDLHAITVPQDPAHLRQQKRELLASLLAIGIHPERSALFYQSSVSNVRLEAHG
jgi:tryptophanyl-tRNA synthetase